MKKKIFLFLAVVLFLCTTSIIPAYTSDAAAKPKLNIKKLDMTLGNTFSIRVYNMKKKDTAVYTSSNPSLVSIESVFSNTRRAVIRARGIGTTKITASIQRPKKKTILLKCRITVTPEAVSIKFAKKKVNITMGQSFKAETIIKPASSTELPIFESSNPSVACVNPMGMITGESPGTATITATLLSSNRTATCKVTVIPLYKGNSAKKKNLTQHLVSACCLTQSRWRLE